MFQVKTVLNGPFSGGDVNFGRCKRYVYLPFQYTKFNHIPVHSVDPELRTQVRDPSDMNMACDI